MPGAWGIERLVYRVRILHILQLSIIIVNYNVRYFLEQCLYSVQKGIDGIDAEIIVVDNASVDDSVNYLRPLFPSVQFICNKKNLGFARANNQALGVCKGEYVLFLNPDTLVPEDCLQKCMLFLNRHPLAAALGVRMLDGKGRFLPESKRSFPSPWVSFFKLTGLAALFPSSRIFNRYALGDLDEHKHHSVEVLAGAFMLVKKEMLLRLNGFDEDYFLYGEDIDLSYRIKKAGAENLYFGETSIIHFKGESSGNTGLSRVKYFYRAMQVFVQKHYRPGTGKLWVVFLNLAIAARGILSAIHRLVKPVLLPLIDMVLVWFSLQLMRLFWIREIRKGEDFNVAFITYALPAFSVGFVLCLAVTGLYDKKYKTSKTLMSLAFAVISMLAVYSLLPETVRFSRGVIMWGGILGCVFILVTRRFFLQGSRLFVTDDEGQTVIVATEKEYAAIIQKLTAAATGQQLLGRVSPGSGDENALCGLAEMHLLQKKFTIGTIIFCIGDISLKEIMTVLPALSSLDARLLFHTSGSSSMVGSRALANGAAIVTPVIDYRITHAYQQRMKRIVDFVLALFFILTIPVHLLLHPKSMRFTRNMFRVLTGSRTWVGYALGDSSLPAIRKSVIASFGQTETVNESLLQKADMLYAKNYDWWQDIEIVFQNYRQL